MRPPKKFLKVISACPPDDRILECAVEGKADYIVSDDHHLKDLEEFQGIKIVVPTAFLTLIKKQIK